MMESVLGGELSELESKNLYRRLRTLRPLDGVHADFEGKKLTLFCGNDYLGLAHHPRVVAAFKNAAEKYGVGAGAARLISGTTGLHAKLEKKLAAFKGKERALLYSTGYLANLGVLSALADSKDVIVMDKLSHASLIDGAKLSGATLRVFPHKNYARCEEILGNSQEFKKRLIVTDSVFSMDGDLADLAELVRLKEKYDALLVIDDAHGTGVFGKTGRGAAEDLHIEERIDIIIGTLSKALGCLGGFAAASENVIEYLINFSRPFIFATALPAPVCAAALEALKIIEGESSLRQKLWTNVRRVYKMLTPLTFTLSPLGGEGRVRGGMNFPSSPIFPLLAGEAKLAIQISEELLKKGFLVPAIRPPTVPKGKSRLRITVSAAHSKKDIEDFVSALEKINKKAGVL